MFLFKNFKSFPLSTQPTDIDILSYLIGGFTRNIRQYPATYPLAIKQYWIFIISYRLQNQSKNANPV